jgi:hypothetical protein
MIKAKYIVVQDAVVVVQSTRLLVVVDAWLGALLIVVGVLLILEL